MKKLYLLFVIYLSASDAHAQCWAKIETGGENALAIRTDGTLWAWGWNQNGQNGTGNNINNNIPIQIGTSANWQNVTSGVYHSCGIKTSGTIWGWGNNSSGELGVGNYTSTNVPQQIGTATDWQSISAGGDHTLAIKQNGTLWGWGNNFRGQLGQPPYNTSINTPVQIGTATNWKSVGASFEKSLVIKTDGTLWFWGANLWPTPPTISPVQVGTDNDWLTVSTSYYPVIALKTNGTLWELNIQDAISTATQVGTATWSSVSAGYYHTIGVQTNGTLWVWGTNNFYQFGNGTNIASPLPLQIGTDNNWLSVSGDETNSYALKTNGTLWATGHNNAGQIGDGTNILRTFFTQTLCSPFLPVTLVSLTAQKMQNNVLLTWQTASETNNKGFDVEKSSDGIIFTTLAFVNGNGNSQSTLNYQYIDAGPCSVKSFYRLKQIDLDGNYKYSSVITVSCSGKKLITISPNPASSSLSIKADNVNEISMVNMTGQVVYKQNAGNNNLHTIDVSKLSPGIYMLSLLYQDGERSIEKVQVIH